MIAQLRSHLRRQEGAYTVIGLIFLVGFVIPAVIVLQNMSIAANVSSQAEGMAYNLSYGAANRAIDYDATANAQQVQLRQSDPAVYQEIIAARQRTSEAAATGGAQNARYEFQRFPDTRPYGGPAAGVDRVVGLTNVSLNPADAQLYNIALNGYPRHVDYGCNPSEGHARYGGHDGHGPTLVCWQDGRRPAGGNNTAWAHFSSGAQVNLTATTPMIWAPAFSVTRIGVATFGRPCESAGMTCAGGQ